MMNKKGLLLGLTAMVSQMTFAEASSGRLEIISNIYLLVTTFALLMGIGLLVLAGSKMKERADNPNNPKTTPTAIIITFIAGALAFNFAGSADLMIKSFLGSDASYCFVVADEDARKNDNGFTNGCWNPESSEILSEVANKVNQMSDSEMGTKLKENAKLIVALFQVIGLVYFLKGLYGLKMVSEGTAREGYGKPIITIIASALVIDLPHTLDMMRATINALGFGV